MTTRELLPDRRFVEHFDILSGGLAYTVGVGYRKDGQVAEIFLDAGKSGTELRTTALELAVAVSVAIQHGCKLQDLARSFPRHETGESEGIMGMVVDRLGSGK